MRNILDIVNEFAGIIAAVVTVPAAVVTLFRRPRRADRDDERPVNTDSTE